MKNKQSWKGQISCEGAQVFHFWDLCILVSPVSVNLSNQVMQVNLILIYSGNGKSLPYVFLCFPAELRVKESFPSGSVLKNLPPNAGDQGVIPGSGRSPGEGNGKPFQYSCLGNSMKRGTWWAIIHRVTEN